MKKLVISSFLAAACVLALTGSVTTAGGGNTTITAITATLTGYQETPLTLASPATGQFSGTVSEDGTSIDFELSYAGLPTPVTAAHIHLGAPATSGGVTVFLCGGGGREPCTSPSGTFTGTITAENVLGLPAQDLAADDLPKLLEAMAAGATYANVHTMAHPGGEIRGQLQVVQGAGGQ